MIIPQYFVFIIQSSEWLIGFSFISNFILNLYNKHCYIPQQHGVKTVVSYLRSKPIYAVVGPAFNIVKQSRSLASDLTLGGDENDEEAIHQFFLPPDLSLLPSIEDCKTIGDIFDCLNLHSERMNPLSVEDNENSSKTKPHDQTIATGQDTYSLISSLADSLSFDKPSLSNTILPNSADDDDTLSDSATGARGSSSFEYEYPRVFGPDVFDKVYQPELYPLDKHHTMLAILICAVGPYSQLFHKVRSISI